MSKINFDHHPQFFTATILDWKPLLKDDIFKDIIIKSLQFLTKEKCVTIYAFVIMPNHIHIIWQVQDGYKQSAIRMRFLRFTAQQIKFALLDNGDKRLDYFKINAKDREYQFWKRNALSIDLWSPEVFMQKLDYLHNNPLQEKWRLAQCAEDYRYSSARFYKTSIDDFDMLSHYNG